MRTVETVEGKEVEHFEKLYCVPVDGEENTYAYDLRDLNYTFESDIEIIVAVKGDANSDGLVNVTDKSILNRALMDTSARLYSPLNAYAATILDFNSDGAIDVTDKTILNRALMDTSARLYQPLVWDIKEAS